MQKNRRAVFLLLRSPCIIFAHSKEQANEDTGRIYRVNQVTHR